MYQHYDYQKKLHAVWESAVEAYRAGEREPASMFDGADTAFLISCGLSQQEMYDYAEDYVSDGEPDFATVAMVTAVRRAYFIEEQQGRVSPNRMDSSKLPPKDAQARGIVWLPRIIEKARAKLRGELPADTMYGCGGDRKFLKTNDIHPAEFLGIVWNQENDEEEIHDWVERRVKHKAGSTGSG